MPNNLQVTLDKSTSPWRLDIDQHGNANHVARSLTTQTITWELTGDAASGAFDSQSDAQPGFAWLNPAPPAGIFGDPALGSNNNNNDNKMTISDLNNKESTTGTWTYQLSATIGGTTYQSAATTLTSTTTNPTIKNE